MKKLFISLLVFAMLLTACGNSEEKKIKKVNDKIMSEANIYILENKIAEMSNEKIKDYTNTIKYLRSTAEFTDDVYEKELNNKLADLLENADLQGVKELYAELGGDLKE